jgi:antibiotic biosynthesis monooxygenase (ABM) superfamily enzyme
MIVRNLLPLLATLAACAGAPRAEHDAVGHVVVLTLTDGAPAAALERDLEVLMDATPGVLESRVGPRADIAVREGITDTSFQVLLWVGFVDEASFQAYLVSPAHQALVERYRPHLEALRVFDAWIGR